MMNYIWGAMLVAGVCFSVANGKTSEFTDSLMSGCTDAVHFIISLAGIMAVWSGLMKIAEESGLIKKISDAVSPVMSFLFPNEIHGQYLRSGQQRNCIFPEGNGASGRGKPDSALRQQRDVHVHVTVDVDDPARPDHSNQGTQRSGLRSSRGYHTAFDHSRTHFYGGLRDHLQAV